MVTKTKSAKKQVKVGNLKLNKETVKDLTPKEAKKIKGGFPGGTRTCVSTACPDTL